MIANKMLVKRLDKIFLGCFCYRPCRRSAAIVHEDVSGVTSHMCVYCPMNLVGVVEICNKVIMLLSQGDIKFVQRKFQRLTVSCDQCAICSKQGQLIGDCQANSLRAPANDGILSFKRQIHRISYW